MADIDEAERNPPSGVSPVLLDRIADRLEAVAAALEEDVPNA
jgi:cell division protein ZapA